MRLFITAVLIAFCMGCTDFPDPAYNPLESLVFTNNGLDKKGYAEDYITDSLLVTITESYTGAAVSGCRVEFEVTGGDGAVDDGVVITDANGNASTRWKLGGTITQHTVEARIFSTTGKFLATIPFTATVFLAGEWNATGAQPDIYITDMAADTINGISMAISGNTLYKQGDLYFNWIRLMDNNTYPDFRKIVIDNNLNFYVGNGYGQLYKSADHGMTWYECNKPWPEFSIYFFIKITSDNYIWISMPGKPLRCSRNGGLTWTTENAGLPDNEWLGDIYRLSDGSYFLLSQLNNLYQSIDGGHSWMPAIAPQNTIKLYVTPDDEIILFNRQGGISIHKSIDNGVSFDKKFTAFTQFELPMDHTVHKNGNYYYLLIPGYGILRTSNFETFEPYWVNHEASDMFMDDEGVFIAKQVNGGRVYYKDNRE